MQISEAEKILSPLTKLITIFGSSRIDENSEIYQIAYLLSKNLALKGFHILTGGGPGVMEACNRGAFEVGGVESIGFNIKLPKEQKRNMYTTKSLLFDEMYIRKEALIRYSKIYIIFAGGFGTLDEIGDVLDQVQNMDRSKRVIFYGKEFYEPLIEFFKVSLLKEKTISKEDLELFQIADSVDEVLDAIMQFN
jgi:uncharacterized protein (TIGR00730 family)